MASSRNIYLIVETVLVFILLAFAAVLVNDYFSDNSYFLLIYLPVLIFQGFWLYRVYIVGHEAAHKKLFPQNSFWNDATGTIVLMPLLTPIHVYRKIHYFHHGFNRKDEHTSALDTFVIRGRFQKIKTVFAYVIWYISVFCGGFFIHSLVSVLLFLFCPPKLAIRISPAFRGWTMLDQFKAILIFAMGILLHAGVYFMLGKSTYLFVLGFPMLAFAWILSFMVYIFHYDTTIGDQVRFNVRSVRRVPVISWILMNFNEHATHHQYPNIPWYELPQKRKALPEAFEHRNQQTRNYFNAILNQFKGPNIVYENQKSHSS